MNRPWWVDALFWLCMSAGAAFLVFSGCGENGRGMNRPWWVDALFWLCMSAGAAFLVFAVCFFGGLFIDVVKRCASSAGCSSTW